MYILNAFKYFFKIIFHKICVGYFCFKAGLYWRGITHDLSKFSPTEFLENIKYYDPKRSPIDISKSINGYSKAWQHHKGRNTHHYEYWIDDIDHGGKLIRMPFEDALEMMCDWLGASVTYNSNLSDLYSRELDWWNKKSSECNMHPHTRAFIGNLICAMVTYDSCDILKKSEAIQIYNNLLEVPCYQKIFHPMHVEEDV